MLLGPGLRCPQAEPSTCSLAVSSQRGGRWLSLCTRVSYLPALMGICTADQPPPAGGEGVTCSGWQRKATRRALPSHCKIHKTGSNKETKSHGGRELLTNQATQKSHAKNLHERERAQAALPPAPRWQLVHHVKRILFLPTWPSWTFTDHAVHGRLEAGQGRKPRSRSQPSTRHYKPSRRSTALDSRPLGSNSPGWGPGAVTSQLSSGAREHA